MQESCIEKRRNCSYRKKSLARTKTLLSLSLGGKRSEECIFPDPESLISFFFSLSSVEPTGKQAQSRSSSKPETKATIGKAKGRSVRWLVWCFPHPTGSRPQQPTGERSPTSHNQLSSSLLSAANISSHLHFHFHSFPLLSHSTTRRRAGDGFGLESVTNAFWTDNSSTYTKGKGMHLRVLRTDFSALAVNVVGLAKGKKRQRPQFDLSPQSPNTKDDDDDGADQEPKKERKSFQRSSDVDFLKEPESEPDYAKRTRLIWNPKRT